MLTAHEQRCEARKSRNQPRQVDSIASSACGATRAAMRRSASARCTSGAGLVTMMISPRSTSRANAAANSSGSRCGAIPYCTSVTKSAAAERRSNTSTMASSTVMPGSAIEKLRRRKRFQHVVLRGRVDDRLVIGHEQILRELAALHPLDDRQRNLGVLG